MTGVILGAMGLVSACGAQGKPPRKDSSAAKTTDSTRNAPLGSRAKGSPSAPITVYEMSDFQCPYCARHALETFPALEREYIETGKVQWVFVNFPLTQIHANAVPAAALALCAADAGKFWPVHDILFRNQRTWAPLKEPGQYLLTLADSVGLARDSVLPCLKSAQTVEAIRAEAQGSERAGANSTPTFYIEGGLLAGAQPLEVFRHILDSIYRVKTGK